MLNLHKYIFSISIIVKLLNKIKQLVFSQGEEQLALLVNLLFYFNKI